MPAPVHPTAQLGFGHGTNLFIRSRPSYQVKVLSFIANNLKDTTNPPFNVLEIGAGTGIFTRALLAHDEWASNILELRAVEPSAGMRAVFKRTVTDHRVTLCAGTFEETGAPDCWSDIIIIAQAFHWCSDYESACVELSRVLKPLGLVVLLWNLEDRKEAQWVTQVFSRIGIHQPCWTWRNVFDTTSYRSSFCHPPEEKVWQFNLPATTDVVVNRVASFSYISVLPDDEKDAIRTDVRKIVERGEGKTWISNGKNDKQLFEYPYRCRVVLVRKLSERST